MSAERGVGRRRKIGPSSDVGARHRIAVRRPPRFSFRRIVEEWPMAILLAGIVVSLLLMVFDRWRRGAFALGAVAFIGAVLRACLPSTRVGLLVVRSRAFDVVFYVATAVLVIWLSLSVDALGTG